MTEQELIAKYNPLNAKNLSEEDLHNMRTLTNDQLDALAKAYPNTPNRKPYLILYDNSKAANKQVFNLSTWQNLRNVRKFASQNQLAPYTFRDLFEQNFNGQAQRDRRAFQNPSGTGKKVVVDLGAQEAASELKKGLTAGKPGGNNKGGSAMKAVPPGAAKPAPAAGKKTPAKKVVVDKGKAAEAVTSDASVAVEDELQDFSDSAAAE